MGHAQQLRQKVSAFTLALLCAVSAQASADSRTIESFEQARPLVRDAQDTSETAIAHSNALSPRSLKMFMDAMNKIGALLRDTAMSPRTRALDADDKQKIYEGLLLGNRGTGSLERLLYSGVVQSGVDQTRDNDGKVKPGLLPFRFVREIVNDIYSTLAFARRDTLGFKGEKPGEGEAPERVWDVLSRARHETLARNLMVRVFDMYEALNEFEKNISPDDTLGDRNFAYVSDQLITFARATHQMRNERRLAEIGALTFYGIGLISQIFGPQILPGFHCDPFGFLSGHTFGSSIISSLFVWAPVYGTLAGGKCLTMTGKTYKMAKELEQALKDPTEGVDFSRMNPEQRAPLEEKLVNEHKAFMQSLRAGGGVLGEHRHKMMAHGYDPNNLLKCEDVMAQLVR